MTSTTILRQLYATIFRRIFSTMAYQFPARSFQSLPQGDHNATASKRVVASSSIKDTFFASRYPSMHASRSLLAKSTGGVSPAISEMFEAGDLAEMDLRPMYQRLR